MVHFSSSDLLQKIVIFTVNEATLFQKSLEVFRYHLLNARDGDQNPLTNDTFYNMFYLQKSSHTVHS
jgi:hypothetical protein